MIWHPKIGFLNLLSHKIKSGIGYSNTQVFEALNTNKFSMWEDVEITFTCQFNFKSYPFDYHECDLTYYSECGSQETVILKPTDLISYGENLIHFSQDNNSLAITNTTTPFIVLLEIKPNRTLWGYISAASIKITFQRNSYALLLGSFYAPTGIFAIMSMTSYVINPDIVSFNYLMIFSF